MFATRRQYENYVAQFRVFVLADPSAPAQELYPFLLVEAHNAVHMSAGIFSNWWVAGDTAQRAKRLGREIKTLDGTTARAIHNFMTGDSTEDAFWRVYLPNVNFYQFMKIIGLYTVQAPAVIFLGGQLEFSLTAFAEFQYILHRARRPKRKTIDDDIRLTKTQPFPTYNPSRKLARVGRVDLDSPDAV